jgi:hypothetical protein
MPTGAGSGSAAPRWASRTTPTTPWELGRHAGAWQDVDLVDPADDRLIEWRGGGPDG